MASVTPPQVSVVIPAHNAASFLPTALASVLSQTLTPLEVIVVDDGSTDDTAEVARRAGPPVRCLQQNHGGVSEARNRGIRESRGHWVAFLDADDVWQPTKLACQLEALRATPGAGACHTAFALADEQGRSVSIVRRGDLHATRERLLTHGNMVGTPSTVICERRLLLHVGGFDPALSQCADWDLWIRLSEHTTFTYVDEPLVAWRRHERNMSRDVELLDRDNHRVIEKLTSGSLRRAALGWHYIMLAGSYFHVGRRGIAVRYGLRALWFDPRQVLRLAAFPYRAARRRLTMRAGSREIAG